MKRLMILAAVLVMSVGAQAQSLKDILGGLVNAVKGSTTTEQSIVGEWGYTQPALALKSDNVLAQAGSSLMSGTIEKKLATYYEKVGLKAGSAAITLTEDKQFTLTMGKRTLQGTYEFDDATKALTLNFTTKTSVKIGKIKGEAQLSGGDLKLLFAADKMLKIIKGLSAVSNNSSIAAISQVADQYDGMSLGMTFAK
ncbi:MAG: DUF4923 family protein [Rikenellaceae bacterium]|nr:DUF4923 family protein [Rikenellaceae bacterium]